MLISLFSIQLTEMSGSAHITSVSFSVIVAYFSVAICFENGSLS